MSLTKPELLAAADAAERFPPGVAARYWFAKRSLARTTLEAALAIEHNPAIVEYG